MLDVSVPDEVDRLRRERDLYRRILDLGTNDEIETFLGEVLRLLVELTGAARGYIELYGASGLDAGVRWSMAEQCTDEEVAEIRRLLSKGIIAAALESGRTIITPSAMLDPRFRDRESVRGASIEAVLCAPVGTETPVGVVYLHSRKGAPPFDENDRVRMELFARHVAPLCDRLLVRQLLLASDDATRPWREKLRLTGVIGHSRALAEALQEAAAAAPLRDVTVLLTGESGTGKTQLARIIHENSPRAGGPFVELNTAAIPESLVESELFGSAQGAHSAAMRGAQGKVAAAQNGTLFLDEIAELPSAAQAKLLQLLHSKEYYPLGASRSQRADIRIIAATNADLAEAVAAGRFREDLYYRLDVLRIRAPALSERREDIPELARFLCEHSCARNGLPKIHLSSAAIVAAQAAEWPGNVRQLANAVERAVARAAAAGLPVAEYRHLFGEFGADDKSTEPLSWQEATRRFQRELLSRTLKESGGNVSEVARRLDLVRSHVYTMMNAFGLGKSSGE
jgi:Nif-specific regulatory protein